MIVRKAIFFCVTVIFCNSFAYSHEPKFSDRTDLNHILESYSESTDVKFVIDPRVKARINMVGIDIDDLSQSNLMDILLIHTFTAYEKDGVVYVLPQNAADILRDKIGPIWGTE